MAVGRVSQICLALPLLGTAPDSTGDGAASQSIIRFAPTDTKKAASACMRVRRDLVVV
jgi:hypothetical protein